MKFRALVIGACCLAISGAGALAAGSSGSLPPPDPTARNLTRAQIQQRAYDACLVTMARVMSRPAETLRSPCQCYARGTIRAMTNEEVEAFRATGYFNDSAREKAFGFVDRCRLQRPV